MWSGWLSSPPVAFALFFGLVGGLYRLAGRLAARGSESEGKRQPYACGEDLTAGGTRLSYRRFFRLALMFVVVHMGTLVVATLGGRLDTRVLGTAYLLGIVLCMDVLVAEDRTW